MTVQKTHTALPDAFRAPGAGPVGLVAEGRLRVLARPVRALPAVAMPRGREIPAVALLRVGLDDDGRILEALPALGFAGVVIEGMGAGHVPARWADLVSRAVELMPVVLASRVAAGPVFERTYGFAGSETDLLARGVVRAGSSGLSPAAAAPLLADGADRARVADAFASPTPDRLRPSCPVSSRDGCLAVDPAPIINHTAPSRSDQSSRGERSGALGEQGRERRSASQVAEGDGRRRRSGRARAPCPRPGRRRRGLPSAAPSRSPSRGPDPCGLLRALEPREDRR